MGNFRMKLTTAAAALLVSAVSVSAATLFETTVPTSSSGRCISGPNDCGGSGQWTIYDDFMLAVDSEVNGITYFADNGSASGYVNTTYSIFSSDPFTSSAIASGTVTGSAQDITGGFIEVTLGGLSIALDGATNYWLGITAQTTEIWTAAQTTLGYGSGFLQSDGGLYDFGPQTSDFAFSLDGQPLVAPVPLPASGLLLFGALAGAAAWRRKSKAA